MDDEEDYLYGDADSDDSSRSVEDSPLTQSTPQQRWGNIRDKSHVTNLVSLSLQLEYPSTSVKSNLLIG